MRKNDIKKVIVVFSLLRSFVCDAMMDCRVDLPARDAQSVASFVTDTRYQDVCNSIYTLKIATAGFEVKFLEMLVGLEHMQEKFSNLPANIKMSAAYDHLCNMVSTCLAHAEATYRATKHSIVLTPAINARLSALEITP
jgi:hypothetical protein